MNQNLPKDPVMLLSVINTNLRDFYPDLDTLCQELQLDKETLIQTLEKIDYEYDAAQNQNIVWSMEQDVYLAENHYGWNNIKEMSRRR